MTNTKFYYENDFKLKINDFYTKKYISFDPNSCYKIDIPNKYDYISENLIIELLKEHISNDDYNDLNNVIFVSYKRDDNKIFIRYYNKYNPTENLSNLSFQVTYKEVPIFKLNNSFYIWKPKHVIYMYYINEYKNI